MRKGNPSSTSGISLVLGRYAEHIVYTHGIKVFPACLQNESWNIEYSLMIENHSENGAFYLSPEKPNEKYTNCVLVILVKAIFLWDKQNKV